MSANPDVLRASELIGSPIDVAASRATKVVGDSLHWNPEVFAREQVRTLVRRIFFNGDARPVKQVVFSAVGPNGHVADICDRVGRALSEETSADIAILLRGRNEKDVVRFPRYPGSAARKCAATRVKANLWRLPESAARESEDAGMGRYWLSRLAELKSEFEYVVIQGPVAGISSEAALLGEMADGIVLVLGANNARKAAVRKVKETLEAGRSRILGTVLSERAFPIPERIYRRL